MSHFKKSVISGGFAFTAVCVLAVGVSIFFETAPSPRLVQGTIVVAFGIGLVVAWAQWNNHIADTRREFLEALDLRWPSTESEPDAVTTLKRVEAPIGAVDVPHEKGFQRRNIPITKQTANRVYEVLLSNGWMFSRSKLAGNGRPLSRDEYDAMRAIITSHAMIKNSSTGELTDNGRSFLSALGQLYIPPHRQ